MPYATVRVKEKIDYVGGNGSREDREILPMYLKEINRIPMLTREDEVMYAKRADKGDKYAKDKLVKANLRFVVNVAKKYQYFGLTLLEVINEGNIGLIEGVNRFDVEKGYHLISYAYWWVRQNIFRALADQARTIRMPINRVSELNRIREEQKRLEKIGYEANLQLVAENLNMAVERVERTLDADNMQPVSLDVPTGDDGAFSSLVDFMEDLSYDMEEDALNDALIETIDSVLETLTEREADVLRDRFALNGRTPLTLKEAGDKYHLSRERIRQIQDKALKKLGDFDNIEAWILGAYVN